MKFNEQPGTYNGPSEVRLVRNLPAPIERVWAYFTDPAKRAKWLAGGEMEPRVGGKANLYFKMKNLAPSETPPPEADNAHHCGFEMQGTITKWEPPFVLGFTFGSSQSSEVTVELSRHGHVTQVVITHRTWGEDNEYIFEFAAGWHLHTACLEAVLQDKPLPPFWASMGRLKAEYKAAIPKP